MSWWGPWWVGLTSKEGEPSLCRCRPGCQGGGVARVHHVPVGPCPGLPPRRPHLFGIDHVVIVPFRYNDDRSDFKTNEPALDYNAALTGLAARGSFPTAGASGSTISPEP
jgi:hypothetical protein